MDYYDIEELKEAIKDHYGTGAVVLGNGNPFNCPGALSELINVDYMSDEEIIEKAHELGII